MFIANFLSFWGIDIKCLTNWKYSIPVTLLFLLTIFISYKMTHRLDIHSDFSVFWNAGNNFKLGNDLYSNIGGAERFIYPPFAAWCFQIYAWLPMQEAGFFLCFFNFGLYAATINILSVIFSFYKIDKKQLQIAIFIAFLLSFRFFWYHQQYVQMNLLMLFLCLNGILAYLKKQETKAIFYFVFAAFIKVLPVFFLFWLFCRGNYKSLLKLFIVSLIFVLIPCFWRGFEQGFQDHLNYYHTFLEPFQNGRVEPKLTNCSLSAMIFKWCLPLQIEQGNVFQLLYFSPEQAQFFYKCSVFALLFAFFIVLWNSRKNFSTPHYYEISFIFCLMHLLSGISWEYHFISLIFVFVPLGLILQEKMLSLKTKIINYTLTFLALIVSIDGQDTVGKNIHLYFNHFCIITILTLFFLFFSLYHLFCVSQNSKTHTLPKL